jgi:tetratricopeptide (TPR) repeat protein
MSELVPVSGCTDPSRKADVVFVHGLGGDAVNTWRYGTDDSTSWPHWLGNAFPNIGVWSLNYPSSPSRWPRFKRLFGLGSQNDGQTMALPDRAEQVLDRFMLNGLGMRPLMFIGHSLGGLLVKMVLRKSCDSLEPSRKAVADQTKVVLFLATPHFGAKLANLADAFRDAFGSTVTIEELREHDAHLRDLYNWYRNHALRLGIETATYYELLSFRGVLTIVNPSSSHPGVGTDPIGLDEDHLSISKPRNRNAQVYAKTDYLLQHYVLASQSKYSELATSETSNNQRTSTTNEPITLIETAINIPKSTSRIPCELPPAAEKFFGRAIELIQLTERLRTNLSTTVVGSAGIGKTALAANALVNIVGKDGTKIESSPFPDGIIYLDLYTMHGQAEPFWNKLANRICGVEFLHNWAPRDRASEACRAKRILVIIEGGEEADGRSLRSTIPELLSVLSPECRFLLLTRLSTQAATSESVKLDEALLPDDAANLLDSLTERHPLDPETKRTVLELLEGHPLALNWAGNLMARDDEEPQELISAWQSGKLPKLSDPRHAEHTLHWLYNRSVRGLEEIEKHLLAAAGLLAPIPFPLVALSVAVNDTESETLNVNQRTRDALKTLVQRGLLRRIGSDHWQFNHVLAYRFARDEHVTDKTMLTRIALWLHVTLLENLTQYNNDKGFTIISKLLSHADALLCADREHSLWELLGSTLLYFIAKRLEEIGRLDLVTACLESVAHWLEKLPDKKKEMQLWRREYSMLILHQSEVLRYQGNLNNALAASRNSLAMSQQLADAEPCQIVYQRDLSVILERIGNILFDQGDLDGALGAYRESLTASIHIAEAEPLNAQWQSDLSVGQDQVGNILHMQGDINGAMAAYEASLNVRKRLVETYPTNAVWQRDLSISHEKIGDLLLVLGNLTAAIGAFRESLIIRKNLVQADPLNARWLRDMSVSMNKVGFILYLQNNLTEALAAFRESLTLIRPVAEADTSNVNWQYDLSVSLEMLGNVLLAQINLSEALAAYTESCEIRERLTKSDTSNTKWQEALSVSQEKIGDVLYMQNKMADALKTYQESLDIRKTLAGAATSNAEIQGALSIIFYKVGNVLYAQKDMDAALAAFQESRTMSQYLSATYPSHTGWLRNLSYSLIMLASIHEQQCKADLALPLAEQSLAIDERLSTLDRTNATWQKDVEVSRTMVDRLREAFR